MPESKIKRLAKNALPSKVVIKAQVVPRPKVEASAEWERARNRAIRAWEKRLEWQMLLPGIKRAEQRP